MRVDSRAGRAVSIAARENTDRPLGVKERELAREAINALVAGDGAARRRSSART